MLQLFEFPLDQVLHTIFLCIFPGGIFLDSSPEEFLEISAISYNSAMAREALAPVDTWKSAEGLLAKMSNEGGTAAVGSCATVGWMSRGSSTTHYWPK